MVHEGLLTTRIRYQMLDILGDVGGFQSAIESILVILLSSRFTSFFMKLCQNIKYCRILCISDSNLGHTVSETRSKGQIIEKSCLHSSDYSFGPIFMKLDVCFDNVQAKDYSGSPWIKN